MTRKPASVYRRFAEQAAQRPTSNALVAPDGQRLSYGQLHAGVLGVSAALNQRLPKGNAAVLLLADSCAAAVAVLLSFSALGRTLAPLNPALAASQLATIVESLAPCAIIHDSKSEKHLSHAAFQGIALIPLAELAAAHPHCPNAPSVTAPADDADSILLLTLSSGSTGDPKPVMLSERNKLERARQNCQEFGVTDRDRILCASPLYHSLGQRLTIMPLISGACLVLLDRFTPQRWMAAVHCHAVSFTIAVSSHLVALLDELLALKPGDTALRALVSSSANIDPHTKQRLFAGTAFAFYEMYGASEVGTVTRLSVADCPERGNSVGRICRGITVAILGTDGTSLPAGHTGQIAVSSPLTSPGYYGRADLDALAWQDGYFLTGDIGRLDAEGYLYFLDRLSDVIITGGSNIYPSDIEAVLRAVADVVDCLVIGIDDRYFGEAVVAVVATGADYTSERQRHLERALRRTVRGALVPQQQPLAYFFVPALPVGATGKIDRRAVRQHYDALRLDLSAPLRAMRSGKAHG